MNYLDWKSQFINCGPGGTDSYRNTLAHALTHVSALFEVCDKPYSGMDPDKLADTINGMTIPDIGNGDIYSSIDETMDGIAKNAIIVQHPNCIAHLHTPPLVPALAAELILSA